MTNEDQKEANGRVNSWGPERMTALERIGTWLSVTQVTRLVGQLANKDIGDFGCGRYGGVSRHQLGLVGSLTLVDVSIDDEVKAMPRVRSIEGILPDVLQKIPSQSLDVVICNNVVEHVWERVKLLSHIRRVLRPRGVAFINVPSWRGKWFLEAAAFRLSLTSRAEINDHKIYFDRRDLWKLLIEAGFLPSEVACRSHKFGLNTYAICRLGR